ncbi:hypothetical protein ACIBQ0_16925 [Nocardia nova]|jgi:hypothetical protein|uniref:hypothetical protein n=1 Tax=Nocardia nova TaxID=37330 RepID=UPI0037A78E11
MAIRFKDGSIPTDHELDCIAQAFGLGTAARMNDFCADAAQRRKQRARYEATKSSAA